jgi:opacity protein-like surface antigen
VNSSSLPAIHQKASLAVFFDKIRDFPYEPAMSFLPNKQLSLVCLTLALSCPFLKAADEEPATHWYTKVDAGLASVEGFHVKRVGTVPGSPLFTIHSDPVARFDGAVGYQFTPFLGTEFRAGYFETTLNTGGQHDLSQLPMLLNVVLRYPNKYHVEPFISLGAGTVYTRVVSDALSTDQSAFVFAYEPCVGVNYQLTPRCHVGLNYKYLITGNPHYDGPPATVVFESLKTHTVSFEIGYQF